VRSDVVIVWSIFVKSSLFFDSTRCARVVIIGMIIELLIMMFDLTDFVDWN
jgi:hypothetical protein